jgi:hypothetical protein
MKFKVWYPDVGGDRDDARTVEACDHEHAAQLWAHWYDGYSAEYSIVGGSDAAVIVEAVADGVQMAFTVSGEMTRSYRAAQRR